MNQNAKIWNKGNNKLVHFFWNIEVKIADFSVDKNIKNIFALR